MSFFWQGRIGEKPSDLLKHYYAETMREPLFLEASFSISATAFTRDETASGGLHVSYGPVESMQRHCFVAITPWYNLPGLCDGLFFTRWMAAGSGNAAIKTVPYIGDVTVF
jgi:hypothetical protein